MKNRNQKETVLPVDATSFKAFAELAAAIVLLLRVGAMAFLRNLILSDARVVLARDKKTSPLQWRNSWWAWQALSLGLMIMTAPTFLFISVLLLINSRCDYPFFWWSLPVIIVVSDTVALLRTNYLQRRRCFTTMSDLSNYHVGVAMETGCILFVLVGWSSGLLPDLIALLSGSHSVVLSLLGSIALAVVFGILSFSHVGVIHAWLSWHTPVRTGRNRA